MKVLHLADLHLGKRVNGFDMLPDQRYILEQVLLICDEYDVNVVAIAGDLYDVPVPPAAATTLLDWFLTELVARRIAVLAVSGNHDSAERLDYAAGLLARQGVHIAGRFTGQPAQLTLHDRFGPVEFTLMPFVRTATVRHHLPDANITDYDSAVAAVLATCPSTQGRRVLVGHQLVMSGATTPQLGGSESCPINIGTVDAVNTLHFAEFSYTALGHIHRAQRVGSDTVRYAGAPLCYHLDECGAEKSAALVTLGRRGVDDLQLVPLTPRRAMRHMTGPLAKLTDQITAPDDYIWATLTDDTPIPDAMAMLRAAYPNAMRLDYAPAGTAELPVPDATAAVRGKPMEELFAEFFNQMNGRELTQEERTAITTLREEAEQ